MFTSQQLPSIIEMIRNQGRNGDTMLAHINPEEAQMLQEMGGSGTINPNTGLPEYFFGIVPSLFGGGGNSIAGLGSLFGLLPSMAKSSPKSSRGFLGGLLANPEIMKKAIESGALGVIPSQLKPGLFKKLEDNGTMPKTPPQPQKPKPNMEELGQKLIKKRGNKSSDDDSGGIFGGMFGALPAIAKGSLGGSGIGSIATGALSPMSNIMPSEMIGGALAPSMKSNMGNIIRKMNPEDLAKGYAMSGRWEE